MNPDGAPVLDHGVLAELRAAVGDDEAFIIDLVETYVTEGDIENDKAVLWWSHGGTLKGTSAARIAFLRKIVEETAAAGGNQIGFTQIEPPYYPSAKRNQDEAFLFYFDFESGCFVERR